jgi:hypothetical protein
MSRMATAPAEFVIPGSEPPELPGVSGPVSPLHGARHWAAYDELTTEDLMDVLMGQVPVGVAPDLLYEIGLRRGRGDFSGAPRAGEGKS